MGPSRRALGLTRILARIENVPMVGPGEVDPDMLSVPAVLSMNHDPLSEEDELYQVHFYLSRASMDGSTPFFAGHHPHTLPHKSGGGGRGGGSATTARPHNGLRLARQRAVPATERRGDRPVLLCAAAIAVRAQCRATAQQGGRHVWSAHAVPRARPAPRHRHTQSGHHVRRARPDA